MDYDYSKAKKLINNAPNLKPLFSRLNPIHTFRRTIAVNFGFFFFLSCGAYFVGTVFNINFCGDSQDFVYEFRVRPDYITGKNNITYRKKAKQFALY